MFGFKLPMILRMADAGAGAGASSAGGGAGAGAGASSAGGGAGAKPWYDPLDAETKGYLQNRGWDKKTAVEAVAEAAKAHREAEKFVGAPANEILRLPKDPNAPEWKGVYERLGKPAEAKGYDLSTVKRAGDKALDDALADTLRNAAFAANLTKDAALRMATDTVKYLDNLDAARTAVETDKLAAEKAELNKNWGNNAAANLIIARNAATALGIKPEAVAALEKTAGYAQVMEMFRTIGTKIGEDRFVTSLQPGGEGIMTRDRALAEKKAYMADKAWVTRYLAGGTEEKRKMTTLDRIITNTTV